MDGILFELITKEMGLLAASVITIMLFVGKIPYKKTLVNKTKIWKRYGEFVLLSLCCGGAFIPGIRPEGKVGTVIIFALLSALAAHLSRKILAPIFLSKLEGKISTNQE